MTSPLKLFSIRLNFPQKKINFQKMITVKFLLLFIYVFFIFRALFAYFLLFHFFELFFLCSWTKFFSFSNLFHLFFSDSLFFLSSKHQFLNQSKFHFTNSLNLYDFNVYLSCTNHKLTMSLEIHYLQIIFNQKL